MAWIKRVTVFVWGYIAGFASFFVLFLIVAKAVSVPETPTPVMAQVQETPTVAPTQTPLPTATDAALVIVAPSAIATVAPTATPLPLNTPTPVATSTPQAAILAMADVERLFRGLIGHALVYEMLRDLAGQVQAGQTDGFSAMLSLGTVGSILNAIAPNLEQTYFAPLLPHADVARTQQERLRGIGARWIEQQIDSGTVLVELETIHPSDELQRYMETLRASGIPEADIQAMVQRLESDVNAMTQDLQSQ